MTRPSRRGRVGGREARPRCVRCVRRVLALPVLGLLMLVAVAQGFSPPTAPTPTRAAAIAAGPATTPAPPAIRHRLHASAPPIAAKTTASSPWSAAATTTTTKAWPSPTASPTASPRGSSANKPATASASTAPRAATTTMRPPTAGSRPTTKAAANSTTPTTEPVVRTASQAERPSAAAATSATVTASTAPSASSTARAATVRPADEEQYPMYAEYPDTSVNLTAGNGPDSAEGDVVPDPDAALRQDAVDEADERERASLADDAPPVEVARVRLTSAVLSVGRDARDDLIPEDPGVDVVFGPVGDVRAAGDLPGVLEAGFEREPGGVVPGEDILDLPVEPAADQDLREHDRLDGDVYRERERAELMLRNQGAAGKQVVIVGAALALVAQFLCLASATRRLRPGHVDVSTAVLFNVEFALIVENLVFMLGVQSVGEPLRCQWVALALHYLHLVTGGWFLANTAFLAYRLRCNAAPTTFRPVAAAVWLLPAVLVSAMYAAQPRSYETHRYCWMAVQRGMLLTFVAPVTLMITVNSALTLRGLRARPVAEDVDKDLAVDTEAAAGGHDGEAVRERDAATPAELRTSLRAAAAMLPLYSADWFLGVVAMDNSTFLTYPLLFLVTNGFLNWFLMVCAWLVVPRESHKEGGDWCGGADGEDLDDEDELLLEDDDAGCWGKGSGYGSAYGTAFNAHGEEQALIWAANAALERSNAMSGEPRVHVRPPPRSSSCSRWDESFLRDGDAALPAASSPAAAALSQELAEMRYDGGISTISS